MRKVRFSTLLVASLALGSCQINSLSSSLVSTVQPASKDFALLEAEYAGFKTQALTQSYLTRKVNHWLDVGNGESLRREIDFARYKHPALLTTLMEDNALCEQTLAVPEVVAYQAQNVDFDTYVSGFSCGTPPEPKGEFQVNSYTTGSQSGSSIAMDAEGNSVIAWTSAGQDGDGNGIYAQRYDAAGVAQGAEFRVNTYTTSNQYVPSVAMNASGDFVIAWQSFGQDGSSSGIYAQRYNAAGVAQGSEFRVNTMTNSNQIGAQVAIDAAGNFVIAWSSIHQGSSFKVYAQRYNAAGVAQGSEVQVNTFTSADHQYAESIAMDDAGNYVIVLRSHYGSVDGSFEVYARRYNASGVAQGAEFRVNTNTTNDQDFPSVAMSATGNFVVTWHSGHSSYFGIYAQRYNAAGVAQGSEFLVNTQTVGNQMYPSVAMDDGGNFAISWLAYDGSGDGVYAQRFNAAGAAQGSEFRVNTTTAGAQSYNVTAMDADGDFVMSWTSPDSNSDGIYAKGYSADGVEK